MTTAPEYVDDRVDRHARQLHGAALSQLAPQTLARLRQARHAAATAAPARRRLLAPWLAGGAVAATLALAVLLDPGLLSPGTGSGTSTITAAPSPGGTTTDPDPAGALQEDPGFYVWLDSVDATALAME